MSKKASLAIKFAIMFAVLALLIAKIRPSSILTTLSGIDRKILLWVLLLLIPNLVCQGLRWGYLVRTVEKNASLREIIVSLLVGFSFGVVSPGRIGELVRGVYVRGESRLRMVGLAAVDKIYQMAIVVVAGMISLILIKPLVIGILALGVICLVVWECSNNLNLLKKTLLKVSSVFPFTRKLTLMVEGFENLTRKSTLIVLALSVLFCVIYFTQFYLLVLAFSPFTLGAAVRTIPLVFLAKTVLVITPVDIGVREATAVLLFSQYGVDKACAFNAAFLLFAINVLLPALVGAFFIPAIRLKR